MRTTKRHVMYPTINKKNPIFSLSFIEEHSSDLDPRPLIHPKAVSTEGWETKLPLQALYKICKETRDIRHRIPVKEKLEGASLNVIKLALKS